jgi:hypothetical protein
MTITELILKLQEIQKTDPNAIAVILPGPLERRWDTSDLSCYMYEGWGIEEVILCLNTVNIV